MAHILTKRGAQDNIVTYEHMCDTHADLNNIPKNQMTLGSTAIVLRDEDDALGVYMSDSNKEWVSLLTIGGETTPAPSPVDLLHVLSSSDYDPDTHIPTVENPEMNVVYLVPSGEETGNNLFDEWIYTGDSWERFGGVPVNNTAVQADWNEDDENADAHILNRPNVRKGSDPTGVVEGMLQNVASGEYSHAEGLDTNAMQTAAHAEGIYSRATGAGAHAEGTGNAISVRLEKIGTSNTYGFSVLTTGASLSVNAVPPYYIKDQNQIYIIESVDTTNSRVSLDRIMPMDEAFKTIDVYQGSYSSGIGSHAEGNSQTDAPYAHAEGNSTLATGYHSHAEGLGATASGPSSHAEGQGTTASGQISHAEGQGTSASGTSSHTEGQNTTASGPATHTEGIGAGDTFITVNNNSFKPGAEGTASHAEGYQTHVTAMSGHAEGYQSEAYDTSGIPGAHAEGYQTRARWTAHSEGNSTQASGQASHAEGTGTKATENSAHAEGTSTQATGMSAHAEGTGTQATSQSAHAEGTSTQATGMSAHAEGVSTQATGQGAHAEGIITKAQGGNSHAEGYQTTANGNNSHTEGAGTEANGTCTHVFGAYNINNSPVTSSSRGTYVEIVGNGTSSSMRSNARTLDWSGNEWLAGTLTVGSEPVNNMDVATKQYVDNSKLQTVHDDSSKSATIIGNSRPVELTGGETYGLSSVSESYAYALGYGSHAEGNLSRAQGEYSHAEGSNTLAAESWSHAEGHLTKALHGTAHAEGETTYAQGYAAHAEGFQTRAIKGYAHSEGQLVIAYGSASHAEGHGQDQSGQSITITGRGASNELTYTSDEPLTMADNLFLITSDNRIRLVTSIDTTTNTITLDSPISGEAVENLPCELRQYYGAIGDYSHTEGNHTLAFGDSSHTEGYLTKTTENYAHAEGSNTSAEGASSHAEGNYTTAVGKAQHVFGEFNAIDTVIDNQQARSHYVEIVGNGEANDSRSNARTLDWDGNETLAGSLTCADSITIGNTTITEAQLQALLALLT